MSPSDLIQPIDQYCERLGPEIWAEPLNAWSNLGFVFAGLWLARKASNDRELYRFGILIIIIGIGSGLFHTFATRWAMAADVVPIGVAVIFALWLLERRIFAWSYQSAALGLLGFGALSVAAGLIVPRELVNGSQAYFPCLLALVLVAGKSSIQPTRRYLIMAASIFAAALAFRTIDMVACDIWPTGTHFMWHLLNAITLLFVGQSLINQKADRSDM